MSMGSAFAVLPAVDVAGGRLAVLGPQGPVPVDAFGGDPLAAARAYAAAGARWLHVVDMDLAFGGAGEADAIVRAIRDELPQVRIQMSGGIASLAVGARYLEAGASRIVLGSSALADEEAAIALLRRLGREALVGIEVQDGKIRSRGREPVELDLMTTLGWLAALQVAGFLVTAVARVGAKAGPDVELIRRIARRGLPTLAAGGIRSLEDLQALRDVGAVGAVVGRAALEGDLDLGAALAWAAV